MQAAHFLVFDACVIDRIGNDAVRQLGRQPISVAKLIVALCALFLNAQQAIAQIIGDCEGSSVNHIVNDLHPDAFVSFANGAIRVADVYVDANLASNVVVVVFHPRRSDLQGAGYFEACTVIYSSRTRSPYFGQVFLRRATANYDANDGLTLSVPVRYYYSDQDTETGTLSLTINQKLGTVVPREQ